MSDGISLISYFASPMDNSHPDCLSRTCGSLRRGSMRRIIFSLFFTTLTPACLAIPLSLKDSSLFQGLLMLLIGYLISFISLRHLSSATYKHQIFNYYSLTLNVLGYQWARTIGFLIILHWLVLSVSYQALLCNFLPSLPLGLPLNKDEKKLFILMLSNVFITVPLTMMKDLENTSISRYVNAVGVCFLLVSSGLSALDTQKNINWTPSLVFSAPTLPCVLSSFSSYLYLPLLQNDLYEPNTKRMRKILFITLTPLAAVYNLVTICWYIQGKDTQISWANQSCEYVIVFNLIALTPIAVVTLRNAVLDVIEYEPKAVTLFLINLVCTGVPCGIVIIFDKVVVLFSVAGIFCGLLMVLVPSNRDLVMLNTDWRKDQKVVGFIYAILVIGYSCFGLFCAIFTPI